MTELDPRIRAIAEHFDFDITWCEDRELFIIKSKCWHLVWLNDSNHADDLFGDFLDDVREFFFDKGFDTGCNGYL